MEVRLRKTNSLIEKRELQGVCSSAQQTLATDKHLDGGEEKEEDGGGVKTASARRHLGLSGGEAARVLHLPTA